MEYNIPAHQEGGEIVDEQTITISDNYDEYDAISQK